MKKKWVIFGVIGVVVLGGGYWAYKHFGAKPTTSSNIMAPAKMGDVSKVITATGTVSFPQAIPLTFQQSGKIVEIDVKPGDTVKAGQVLAKTDDTNLRTAVIQQQANLASAQAKLQSLKDSFNVQTQAQAQASLAGAQQGVLSAQQNLITAQQNADPAYLANQVTLANQNVTQASDALAKAEQSQNSSSIQSAQSSLSQAQASQRSAQNAQNGGAAQALASAEAQTRSAQANLTSAQYQVQQQAQGPKAGDLQSAQSGIELAQIALTSAQTNLANAAITAPIDAVVVSAPLQLYQQSDAKSIITITPQGNNLEVNAAIDQADISQIKIGQKVDVTLDAYSTVHNSGVVSLVDIQGTTVQNVTTFNVTVALDQASDLLRAGMNANISIIVEQVKNVLTVPSEAIKTMGNQKEVLVPITPGANTTGQANQSGTTRGNYSANASSGRAAATVKPVPVVTGLDDGTNVEIKSGISEGQEVVIGTRTLTAAKTATAGFSLGGGGSTRALGGGGGYGGAARGN